MRHVVSDSMHNYISANEYEIRMPLLMITAIFVPVGLLLYGWTANYRVFWLVPDIGIGIFGIGNFFTILRNCVRDS